MSNIPPILLSGAITGLLNILCSVLLTITVGKKFDRLLKSKQLVFAF